MDFHIQYTTSKCKRHCGDNAEQFKSQGLIAADFFSICSFVGLEQTAMVTEPSRWTKAYATHSSIISPRLSTRHREPPVN